MGKYSYNKTKKLFSQISQIRDKEELQEVYKALGEFRDSVKRKRDRFKYRVDKAYSSLIFYFIYFSIAIILNLPFAFYITGFAFGFIHGGKYIFNRISENKLNKLVSLIYDKIDEVEKKLTEEPEKTSTLADEIRQLYGNTFTNTNRYENNQTFNDEDEHKNNDEHTF